MLKDDYIYFKIDKTKHIALIAHDGKKKELVAWVQRHKEELSHHVLCGTGTTARIITEETGLPVKAYNSGPLGGDQQIGAKIVEGKVDFCVFLWDPLESQPHDPDVKALLRIAVVYDIPIANNLATADFLLASSYMNTEYNRKVENFHATVTDRVKQFAEDKQ
ncbi:MAG: methylglyoxal synthase [Lachnospiraceae bacterium]|nr:methylglyoxal synthase [Lachnospiraceae bacterium]